MTRDEVVRSLTGLKYHLSQGDAAVVDAAIALLALPAPEAVGPMPWRLQIAAMILSGLAESQERDERLVGWSLGTADALLAAAPCGKAGCYAGQVSKAAGPRGPHP